MPFRKILFPVDFSDATMAMVPYVLEMARRFDAEVTLLNAFNPAPDFDLAPRTEGRNQSGSAAIPYLDSLRDLRQERERHLMRLSEREFPGVNPEVRVEDGDAATVIEWIAQRDHPDLIMMPTKGRGRFRRLLLGSITAKILHDLRCPLFTTAHEPDPRLSAPVRYRSIICAVELNPEADAVFRMAGLMAEAYEAEVILLHVEPSLPHDDGQTLAEKVRHGFESAMAGGGRKASAELRVCVPGASVADSIRRVAIEEKVDLVVTGRGHETGNISRIWSQLYTIIRESPCPVLSV